MSRNGSGVYTLNTSGQPVVAGTTITSTAFNAAMADISTALTQSICYDGQTTCTGVIPFAAGLTALTVNEYTLNAGVPIKAISGSGTATAGYVGEFKSGQSGGTVALTTSTAATITSVSLTAGDWLISGTIVYNGQAGTIPTDIIAGFSTTTNTLPSSSSSAVNTNRQDLMIPARTMSGSYATNTLGPHHVNLSATTTYYLVGYSNFSAGTMEAYGTITAWRPR